MNSKKGMFLKEYLWRTIVTVCGLFVIVLTLVIGGFLVYKGSGTFTKFGHSIGEFLFSADWAPVDNITGGGSVGTRIFIVGSLCTCGLGLLIATPFAIGSAIFMTEISPKFGEKFYRPVIQIFAGIPSVVYGWVGLTVLVPAIKTIFNRQVGHSILAAGLVLAIMILPTVINISESALKAVPRHLKEASLALGGSHIQTIFKVMIPAAKSGIVTAIVLGVGRAIGEAMAIKANRLDDASTFLSKELGREPKIEELAKYLSMTEEEVKEVMKISLDALSVMEADIKQS